MSASSAPVTNPQFTILSGYTQAPTDQMATNVLGAHVYDGTAQNANDLGKINDLVLNQNGSIAAVIVGVGGFLGIGEKQVAVDYHALQWQVGPDNNRRFVLQTTKDELTSAPDFKTVAPNTASAASGAAPASGSGVDANGNAMASSSAQ
jgi:sporulation protein YlmC with PRC-barrel domain